MVSPPLASRRRRHSRGIGEQCKAPPESEQCAVAVTLRLAKRLVDDGSVAVRAALCFRTCFFSLRKFSERVREKRRGRERERATATEAKKASAFFLFRDVAVVASAPPRVAALLPRRSGVAIIFIRAARCSENVHEQQQQQHRPREVDALGQALARRR